MDGSLQIFCLKVDLRILDARLLGAISVSETSLMNLRI